MSKQTKPTIDESTLIKALNTVFTDGKWEIPDDAVAGVVTHKVNQLEAQVKSLTNLVKILSAKVNGSPLITSDRVDALAAQLLASAKAGKYGEKRKR